MKQSFHGRKAVVVHKLTDATETVDGDLDLSLGDGVDGGGLWKE